MIKIGMLWMVLFFCACTTREYVTGFKPMFTPNSMQGWHVKNGTAEYEIKGDTITGITKMGTRNTFLCTDSIFGDFVLSYEVRVDSLINSGVQIRSLSKPDYYDGAVHGYQVEIDPSPRSWSGGIYDESRRGWLYNLEKNEAGRQAFLQGEWNRFHVEAQGDTIKVWLNEVPTAYLVDSMSNDGFIGLQVHSISSDSLAGRTIQWKNVKICEGACSSLRKKSNIKLLKDLKQELH